MQFEQEQRLWQELDTPEFRRWKSGNLRQVWSHPTLRSLRRQLAFETGCWVVFLALYYSALDGDTRPLGWNVALVAGLLLLIGHGLLGYRLAARPIGDAPLRLALEEQLSQLRWYSWVSMTLRAVTLVIFFGFIFSGVAGPAENFRIWFLLTAAIYTGVALAIQYGIWRKRLDRLRTALSELS